MESFVMKSKVFVEKCLLAVKQKTLYVKGGFGQPLKGQMKRHLIGMWAYNARPERAAMINAADSNTYAFDCVCFVKGILWGWDADASHPFGGAYYRSGGVPDVTELGMLDNCVAISTDFSALIPGEYLWMPGHCGVYVGGGKVAEATPAYSNGVCITKLSDRKWKKHGMLKFVDYSDRDIPAAPRPTYFENKLRVKEIAYGSVGYPVTAMQAILRALGYDIGKFGVDGDFGHDTLNALKQFQADRELAADGICGINTWRALLGW